MLRLAVTYALRELRLGTRGLRIAIACLVLGVATIAAVGGLREGIEAGLAANATVLLGGDLDIQGGAVSFPDTLRRLLQSRGARVSAVTRMRSLLASAIGDRQLVELKAVDIAYPLAGSANLDPSTDLQGALAQQDGFWGIVVDPIVLQRLSLRVGDKARLGTTWFTIRGAIAQEPDRIAGAFTLGPSALISEDALPSTGLVQPGSLVNHDLRAILPQGADPEAVRAMLHSDFPESGWRIRLATEGTPSVRRFIDQAGLFLTLVGLSALLIGGVGVGMGVRSWLEGRARSIATLRCIGASRGLIFATYFVAILVLAALAIVIGLIVGASLPIAALSLFSDLLPAPPHLGLYPGSLLLAAAYGAIVSVLFTLPPLARAARLSGAALFRDAALPARLRLTPHLVTAIAVCVAALIGLTLWQTPDHVFALGFCAAAAGTLGLFRLAGAGLVRLLRQAPRPASAPLRLGLTALHAPGAPSATILVALGLGLAILGTLGQVRGNIEAQLMDQIPANAPALFVIDIQRGQTAPFDALVRSADGFGSLQQQPSLRARIVGVNGIPAEKVQATPDTRWALDGDRALSWSAAPPDGTRLVAGSWWSPNYTGPPLVSIDAGLARGWNLDVGGRLTVNVAGRNIDMQVANLRDVAWRTLSLNFALIGSPGLLQGAPQTSIAAIHVTPNQRAALLRRLADAFPNTTAIDVSEVLATLAGLLSRIGAGLSAVGALALISGGLVMAGAVAATQPRRVADAMVLKTLGATRWQIRAAWVTEFAVLGLTAGILALGVGTAASWAVLRLVLRSDWLFDPGAGILTVLGALFAAVLLGLLASEPALRERPARRLRTP